MYYILYGHALVTREKISHSKMIRAVATALNDRHTNPRPFMESFNADDYGGLIATDEAHGVACIKNIAAVRLIGRTNPWTVGLASISEDELRVLDRSITRTAQSIRAMAGRIENAQDVFDRAQDKIDNAAYS